MSDFELDQPEHDLDQMVNVQTLYRDIITSCLETETDPIDVLVALTLVLRDLALSYHGPDDARSRSVDALDHSFALDAPVWPGETVH